MQVGLVYRVWSHGLDKDRPGLYTVHMDTRSNAIDKAIAAQLRGYAAQKNISKTKIAEESGMSTRTVTRYMTGERSMPISTLFSMTQVLGIDMSKVLSDAENSVHEFTEGDVE